MARILFLYSEMMPYMEATVRSLIEDFGDEVTIVAWDVKKLTPHTPQYPSVVLTYKRSELDLIKLKGLVSDTQPDLIYVSGRMDKMYLAGILSFKDKIPIVAGCDNQWRGTLKHIIASRFSYWVYRKYFSHFWVPGPLQYEFARRMGYPPSRIVLNLYTGNTALFSKRETIRGKSKKIIFLGRLERIKGVDLLVTAFKKILPEHKENWKLLLIGEGSLRKQFQNIGNIECTGFLSQEDLLQHLQGDCIFCLPSRAEPWGVVVHEMTCAGIPIITSDSVGAAKDLVIPGFNGFIFPSNNLNTLHAILNQMISMAEEERLQMGQNSRLLASRFSSTIAAASLRSVLK